MWGFLFLVIFGLFCIIFQTNPILNHFFFPIKPDLTIPLALYICLFQKPVQGCFLVLWMGFLMDLFSGGVMGIFLFLRMILFSFLQLLKKLFFLENRVFWFGLVLILFLFDSLLIYLLFEFMGKDFGSVEGFWGASVAQGFFSSFLFFLFFPLLNKFIKER